MRLTWLHISDIHFHFSSYESLRLREEFIKRIKNISNSTKIDCIFCTGDLADKNGIFDSSLVEYLENIANTVGVIKQNVFIVPGNHDHDRNSTQEVLSKIYEFYDKEGDNYDLTESVVNRNIDELDSNDIQILQNSFSNFIQLCNQFYNTGNYNINSNVVERSGDGFFIVNVNTCLYDCSSNDEKKELHIGIKQLYEIIKKSNFTDSHINIAIGHHPTSIFSDKEKQRFLDCLSSNKIHFYLCGHKHKSEFVYHNDYDIFEIICSYGNSDNYSMGGFSVGEIDTEQAQCYVDFFNWKSGNSWVRDTTINNCDEIGRCYIRGDKYRHIEMPRIAIPIKLYGTEISNHQISAAIGEKFEILPYLSNEIDINTVDWDVELDSIKQFANSVKQIVNKQINIFSIAPIPLLISFGYEMQNNSDLVLFQFDRENNRWVNYTKDNCPEYEIIWEKKSKAETSDVLIIKMSTSTEIMNSQLPKLKKADTIHLSLINKELGMPLYENHYKIMLNSLFKDITPKVNQYKEIHLFASIPAGMALETGRRIQKGVFPKVYLYNYNKGYSNTNIINE